MYRCLLPSAADIGVHTAHRPASSIYRYIGIYRCIYRYTMAAVSVGAYECTLHTSLLPLPVIYTDIYADIYTDIYTAHRPPSSHIPIYIYIYHTHISICAFLLVVHDSNSSFGGRLRHRLVAPVFHGSATLTRPLLQPYLNISQYISIHIYICT
jgi:hypothetical protein